jgi:type IV secretory pathway VirB2 component (pilin)
MFFQFRSGKPAMSMIQNERTKLSAAFLNALATAIVAAGLFAPVAAIAYGISEFHIGKLYIFAVVLICIVAGATLHWTGRALLGGLRE